jgi:hypothetical protein
MEELISFRIPVIHANRLSVVMYLSSATGQPSIPIGTLVRPTSTGSAPDRSQGASRLYFFKSSRNRS